jgi:hypothetical protein
MEQGESPLQLWRDLREKVDGAWQGAGRYVERLKRHYQECEYAGEEVISLVEVKPVYEKALELLRIEVEVLACKERLTRLEEKEHLYQRAFWLTVYEETGYEEDTRLTFDPIKGGIRKRGKREKDEPDSIKKTLDEYKELVGTALGSPLSAGRMAQDPCLPSWLQQMCRVLTRGDLKPGLQQVIELCIEKPSVARQYHALGSEEKMPDWFLELMKVMGSRKKWNI